MSQIDEMITRSNVERLIRGTTNVVPTLADGKSLSGAAGAWAQGAWVEISSDVGSQEVELVGINVEAITGIHEVEIGVGAGGSEVGVTYARSAGVGFIPVNADVISPNSRIAARTASKAGGTQAVEISLVYKQVS